LFTIPEEVAGVTVVTEAVTGSREVVGVVDVGAEVEAG
jgi:hypothetical protein